MNNKKSPASTETGDDSTVFLREGQSITVKVVPKEDVDLVEIFKYFWNEYLKENRGFR